MNAGSWYLSLVINLLLYSSNMHCMLLDIDETLPEKMPEKGKENSGNTQRLSSSAEIDHPQRSLLKSSIDSDPVLFQGAYFSAWSSTASTFRVNLL